MEILLLVLEEGLRRLGDEDLTSVPGGPDTGRPMDGEPGVATARCSRLARVQAHANLDLHAFRPGVRRDRELALDSRQECISRTREGDEEGVALGIDLVASVRFECRAQQALVLLEHAAVALPQQLDEPCRPFDVGEEEGDGSARQVGHVARSVNVRRSARKRRLSGVPSCRWLPGQRLSSIPMPEERPDRPVRSQYEEFMRHVYTSGAPKQDRTGTGTVSVFGHQMRFDLAEGFPLVTTKKVHFPSVANELLWFLRGDGNVRWLQEQGVTIWNEWADEDGDLGPVYGVQWRTWPTPDGGHVDQIAEAVRLLREEPDSRRIVVSAWNVADLPKMALMPCHAFFQLYVSDGRVSCQVYQRSADVFLGVPFNIASYALLTHLLAQQADLDVGELIWTGGDCHIYDNHREQVETQLSRRPFPYPSLSLARRPNSISEYAFEDFEVVGYQHHPPIRAPVAV